MMNSLWLPNSELKSIMGKKADGIILKCRYLIPARNHEMYLNDALNKKEVELNREHLTMTALMSRKRYQAQ